MHPSGTFLYAVYNIHNVHIMAKKITYSAEQKKYLKTFEFFSGVGGVGLHDFLKDAKNGRCSLLRLSLIDTSPSLSEFEDEIVNRRYSIFIDALVSLIDFILLNFIRSDRERDYYVMIPQEMRILSSKTDGNFFFKEKIELPALAREVENTYCDIWNTVRETPIADTLPQEKALATADAKLTSEKLGIGFLTINGQEIKIGQAKNVTFKLLEALCPFGTPKAVETVYRATTTGQSKHRAGNFLLPEKKIILRSRIKELQDIFNRQKVSHREKIKVMLDFNDEAGTVCLRQK